jgi:protein O-mannosyl-transferase
MEVGKASKRKSQKRTESEKFTHPENEPYFLHWWLIAALAITAFLAYAHSLSFDFVYDDELQVLRNPWIRDWSQVGKFFFTDVWRFGANETTNYYRPLHMVAHATGYMFSGLKPFGYHLINILLHCLNTLLAALFAYRLTRDTLASAAGGFLFALHPVHAESVAWIAGITDPLCAVFYFGALYVYLDPDPSKNRKVLILSSLLFLGALFSKEMAFTLPLVAILLDICVTRRLRWARYAVFIGTFGVYALLRLQAIPQFNIAQQQMNLNIAGRLLSSIMLLGEYMAKAFVPFDINAFHVFRPATTIWDPRLLLSSLALLAFALGAWYLRNDKRVLFLLFFIPISLLPVLNITGVGSNTFADRYLYIPSLGSCLLIPILGQKACGWKQMILGVPSRKVAVIVLTALSLGFAGMVWKTASMWSDNKTLYAETLKRSPESGPMAANMARYYFENNQNDQAEYWLSRAQNLLENAYIKNNGELCANYVRRSSLSLRQGKLQEALKYLERGYQLNPQNISLLANLGTVYILMKEYSQARKWCETALTINPRNEVLYNNLAFIALQLRESDTAIENARKALEIFPEYADAYLNLARAYATKGLVAEASNAYQSARRLNPSLQSTVDQELRLLHQN